MSMVLNCLYFLLPKTRDIKSAFYLSADSLIKNLSEQGIETYMTIIPEFDNSDLDDQKIAEIVFDDRWDFHAGSLFIHAPACSRYDLPDFECQAEELDQFVDGYCLEMLFSGDVIFVSIDSRTLTIFHHEGAYAHYHI